MFVLRLTKMKLRIITLAVLFLGLTVIYNRSLLVSGYEYPNPLERIDTEVKVIAFTINVDWGEEYIPKMLEIFRSYNAKVTFFVTGRWASKNPDLLKQISENGHQIGNHGYYHSHPDKLSPEKTKEEILAAEKVIRAVTGINTVFYAPPYGERGPNGLKAASDLGYTTVLWTLDTIDWRADSTPEIIAQRILEPKAKDGAYKKGAIVLMHPKENTVKALPYILSRLQADGFQTVTLEKLITYGNMGNTTP